jgi:hypothetical protein
MDRADLARGACYRGRVSDFEAVLGGLAIFEQLRPDEVARIARRFTRVTLAAGERHATEGERLAVVIAGDVELAATHGAGELHAQMTAGDRYGTFSMVTGYARPFALTARRRGATIAILDRAGYDAMMAEFPAVALPLAREVAGELAVRDDFLRQLLELHGSGLPEAQLQAAIAERRTALLRRGAHVTRSSTRSLFHRLVVQKGAEPPFWMLVGFIGSLGGARLVVHLILKYGLEKRLFALVPGNDPNPMHIHHFNYGLFLIGSVGLASMFPFARRFLRPLALLFGIGAGLVFDEFALFWNLNPEYSQELSVIAAGLAAAVLLQLVYFRSFWTAIVRRAWLGLRGAR